jgi:hypothetical protein
MDTLRCNDYSALNHLHFDYFVVRLRIGLAERAKSIPALTGLKMDDVRPALACGFVGGCDDEIVDLAKVNLFR